MISSPWRRKSSRSTARGEPTGGSNERAVGDSSVAKAAGAAGRWLPGPGEATPIMVRVRPELRVVGAGAFTPLSVGTLCPSAGAGVEAFCSGAGATGPGVRRRSDRSEAAARGAGPLAVPNEAPQNEQERADASFTFVQ